MSTLQRQSLLAYGAPLRGTTAQCPAPHGCEVLLRIARCGVCHSDLHLQDGHFELAEGKQLDVRGGRTLPFTLGHEIAGIVEQLGEDAKGTAVGEAVAVYPWIGCGQCAACSRGAENICAAPRHLGVNADGGFASHVIVPDARYLLPFSPLTPAQAGTLMCSGLTAYAALNRLAEQAAFGPLLLVGMGGVGMMGLALARVMFKHAPLIADTDAQKRAAALAAGAASAIDPGAEGARRAVLAATDGGVLGLCDFVGSGSSLAFATGVLAKGGKAVVTGLLGGTFKIPTAFFGLKAISVEGIQTGTLEQARAVIDISRRPEFRFPPITERPLAEAQAALDALRAGKVVGRTVLCPS